MDRLIFIAATGGKHTLDQQASVAHNLANLNTGGFKAQLNAFRAVPVYGDGLPTRAFVVEETMGTDFEPAPIQHTGRPLDVAIQGRGWLAVQVDDGEGYTRAGSLVVSPTGLLQTHDGRNVLGDGGPINIPPDTEVTIAKDGTISTVPSGSNPSQIQTVGRLKLVNPAESQLQRGNDGAFRLQDGCNADVDGNVNVISGALEGSNVNAVDQMVEMIALARAFEMQMKLISEADQNDRQASQLLAPAR